MKVAILAMSIALFLPGCTVTPLTPEGSQVRAMTEFDKPRCTYITDVTAYGIIQDYDSSRFVMQALHCAWKNRQSVQSASGGIEVQRISAEVREKCDFKKDVCRSQRLANHIQEKLLERKR